jgi:hypothetical protein
MNVKPLKNRYLVFSVPVRRKIEGSFLFKGNANRYAFNRAEEIWILACGPEVKEVFPVGTHAWLNDSFELEPTNIELWNECKDKPEFKRLQEFVDNCDGDVKTSLVSEDSILAIDDDYEAKEINRGIIPS